MTMHIRHLIGGVPVESREVFTTVDPATQDVLAEVASGGETEVNAAVAAAKAAFDVPVHLHKDDLPLYDHAVEQGALFGLVVDPPPPPVDRFYTPGQKIPFGDFEVRPHHTPGHCPGGVCLEVARQDEKGLDLFVGDTLFAGSIGRTDLPGGDYATLIGSIRSVLFPFGDDARVYPGHGPDTTIGRERRTNPFLQAI